MYWIFLQTLSGWINFLILKLCLSLFSIILTKDKRQKTTILVLVLLLFIFRIDIEKIIIKYN